MNVSRHPGNPSPSRRVARLRGQLTLDRVSFFAVFLILPVAIFVVFELSPEIQALYYAMTDWRGFSPDMNFIGLGNYVRMFHDSNFLISLRNSTLLVLVVPTLALVSAFAIATVVTAGGKSIGRVKGLAGGGVYRVISFFPYTVPAIVVGIIWAQIFNPNLGLFNGILTRLGFDKFAGFAWLGRTTTAMPVAMFVVVWSFIGFYAVLFVAAIKGIPAETYEAARIDGAGRFRTAISITLPQIADSVRTAYIYLGLVAIDAFVYMQALTPEGGPKYSTLTMSQNLYMEAFRNGNFGYATAIGVVLAIVTMLYAGLVMLVFRLLRGRSDEGRS